MEEYKNVWNYRVWALAIYTGNGETGIEHNSMYSMFTISLVLTTEGLAHMDDVSYSILKDNP